MHADLDNYPILRAVKALHLLEEALLLLKDSGAHFACPAVEAAIMIMKAAPNGEFAET